MSLKKYGLNDSLDAILKEIIETKNYVKGLETKVVILDKKLNNIIEIVTANGQGIEVISQRVDKLES